VKLLVNPSSNIVEGFKMYDFVVILLAQIINFS